MAYRIHIIPKKRRRIIWVAKAMKTPYGLQVIESCLTCPMMKDRLFCNLPPRALEGLDAISSSATYPKGAILFVEGQDPRGVFVICNGRVKLSARLRGWKIANPAHRRPGRSGRPTRYHLGEAI